MTRTFTAFSILLFLLSSAVAQSGRMAHGTAKLVETPSQITAGATVNAVIEFTVNEGFHAQSNKPLDKNLIAAKLKFADSDAFTFGEPVFPEGEIKDYPLLGKLSVYEGTIRISFPFTAKPDAALGSQTINATLTFQACDDSVCFAPESVKLSFSTSVVAGSTTQPANASATTAPAATRPAFVVKASPYSAWQAFGLAMVAGLLFNVMPCVLPVLPLKAMGFYEVSQHRRGVCFAFGVVFSLGVISVFAALSIFVLVLGWIDWGSLFSKPLFVWSIVAILVVSSFGLLGAFATTLPSGIYDLRPKHDTYTGNFFWGILTAVLATPCTAPLLPAVLLWAVTQPPALGVLAMIFVGVGMASPYLVLSAFPEVARKFPRTGPASELFKQMMGFMLLASAAYFAGGRLVHGVGFWWIVTAVIAVAALFLVARTGQLFKTSLAAGVSSAIAVAMIAGAVWWTVKITGFGIAANIDALGNDRWTAYSDDVFAKERAAGRPVLVKFTANWCATCQVIEGTVFSSESIWTDLKNKNVAAIKVDLTNEDAPGHDLLLKLNPAGGIPLTAIWAKGSDTPIILSSIYSASELREALKSIE